MKYFFSSFCFFFCLLSLCAADPTPPQLSTQFVSDYQFGIYPSGSGSNYRPFFHGKFVLDVPSDPSLPGSGFVQFLNDGEAPFLLDTVFILTPSSEGYQEAGDGRCWDIGYLPSAYYIIFVELLQIPPYATYMGTNVVLGQKCTIWQWDEGYNVTAAVRVSDSALIMLSNPEWGISMAFPNVVTGKPDPAWFNPPMGPCLSPNSEGLTQVLKAAGEFFKRGGNLKQIFDGIQNMKSIIPEKKQAQVQADPPIPKLIQQFTTEYKFGIQTEQKFYSIFTGHVGMDYQKRNLRFVLQDDQAADMPFILSTTSLSHSNQTNSSDISGYQFLDRGSCWQTPEGFLYWILNYDFAIPNYATFTGNVTINNITCEIWEWHSENFSFESQQRVTVDPKTGIFYTFEIVFYEIDFVWKNSNFQPNYNPPNFFNPPPGCLPWDS